MLYLMMIQSIGKIMDEERKSFEQLVSEKAGCFEFAWNGFIRIYEEGEERCECKDCIEAKKFNEKWNESVRSDY